MIHNKDSLNNPIPGRTKKREGYLSWNLLFYFTTGFCAASSLLNDSLVQKFAFSFVELFFLPLLVVNRRDLLRGLRHAWARDGDRLFFSFAFVSVLFAIGVLFSDSGIRGVLGATRGYVYILVLATYYRNNPLPRLTVLYALSLGALCGDLVLMLKGTMLGAVTMGQGDLYKTNLMALYLCISCSVLSRRILLLSVGIGVVVATTLLGAFRINILVGVLALLFGIITACRKAHFSNYLNMLTGVGLAMIVGYFVLGTILNSNVLSRYSRFRIIDRTVAFFSGDIYASQDLVRFKNYYSLVDELPNCLFPHGMIAKNDGGLYNDLPIYEFLYVFSVPIAFCILFSLASRILKLHKMFLKNRLIFYEDNLIIGFSYLIILFLIANGRFLYIPYESVLFGMCLGRLYARNQFMPQNVIF